MAKKKNRAEVNNNGSMSLRAIFMPTMLKPQIAATKVAPRAGFPNQSISFMCFIPVAMANLQAPLCVKWQTQKSRATSSAFLTL